MKRSQAIHRRLTEDHEQISAKAGMLAAGLLARAELDEGARERARIVSIPSQEPSFDIRPANDVPAVKAEASTPPVPARSFPYHEFQSDLDPAVVKARYQVGPTDPTLLFVGDLDERHAPDLLVKAMPALLKKHPQARLVIVGDGALLWPLRVMSRYMLLDYAVRIPGHIGGREVRELVVAADIMVVPSRVDTEDWQILSAWSARRPVVATPAAANQLCRHDKDSVLTAAEAPALVGALDRVLSDPDFARRLGEGGHRKLLRELGLAVETSASLQ